VIQTGGHALAAALVGQGVKAVFALPGVQLDWAFDGLYEQREHLRVFHTRHEQTTAYMADGYARTTGRVGVCMMVPGPGVLNAAAGLATAYACSSPVLCLAGQVDSRGIDAGLGLLHEIGHQEAVLASVTAWSARALTVRDIPRHVRAAFGRLRTGRPRPVAIELPPDVLQATGDVSLLEPAPPAPLEPDPKLVREAADLLRQAERPVIYSGGGTLAAGGWAELQRLAERLEAPVVMSTDGRGALSDRHDLAHTGLTGEALVADADVILAVGTRFWQPARVWGVHRPVIRVDADPREVSLVHKPQLGIVGDARLTLDQLHGLLEGHRARPSRRTELRARKDEAARRLDEFEPQAAFSAALRRALPDDAITVNDLTQVTFFGTVGFPVYAPRTFVGPGYQGTLGSAFGTALGAQVGNPERIVVAVAGDGGFMYTLAELATQRQHDLPVISVVFNDAAFGNVKRTQQLQFDGRLIASDLVNPDFCAVARAFGVDADAVKTPDALEACVRSAVAARRPTLIEVRVGEMSNVFPLVGRAGGLYPYLLG
jgi:acetolactate synthase I/II/III large subunit